MSVECGPPTFHLDSLYILRHPSFPLLPVYIFVNIKLNNLARDMLKKISNEKPIYRELHCSAACNL